MANEAIVIRAAHYDDTVEKLKADPIIVQMAHEMDGYSLDELEWPSGPRHEFMMATLHEYKSRGGEIGSHIGGPAEAILQLLRKWKASK
jgi:hypothetical protein